MLAPFAVAGSLVVDSCQEVEVFKGDLVLVDAKLVFQLALSGTLCSSNGVDQVCAGLGGNAQRVRAAGVGPHVWEGNLLSGALLKEQLVLVVEEEDGKGTVQESLVDVGHQVAYMWKKSY